MEDKHFLTTNRIEAFSDGVFAIVVTLLVLDLRIPDLINANTTSQMVHVFFPLIPQFISFALSFVIVCIFWVNHHQFFSVIRKANIKLLWLNNLTLFWVCFIPFPTAFLGRNSTSVVAVMLFGGVLFCTGLSFTLMTNYVFGKSNLVDQHISFQEKKAAKIRGYYGVIAYALSIILAPLSVYISLAIFILTPLYYFVPRRFSFG